MKRRSQYLRARGRAGRGHRPGAGRRARGHCKRRRGGPGGASAAAIRQAGGVIGPAIRPKAGRARRHRAGAARRRAVLLSGAGMMCGRGAAALSYIAMSGAGGVLLSCSSGGRVPIGAARPVQCPARRGAAARAAVQGAGHGGCELSSAGRGAVPPLLYSYVGRGRCAACRPHRGGAG